MRAALNAITDELKRLKSSGVKTVMVSPESMDAIRKVVKARGGSGQPVVPMAKIAPVEKSTVLPTPIAATRSAPSVILAERPVATASAPAFPPPPTVSLPSGDKRVRWDALLQQVVNDPVCRARVRPGKKVVLGVGDLDAKIFFCGEAPGADEEEKGEPFVGPAGQLLTKMIQAMGLARSQVYIGNIMNWRPELPLSAAGVQVGNRPPTSEEMAYCLPYLRAQLEIVNPEVIVALGSTAAQGLLGVGTFKTLGEIRGRWKQFAEKPVMVTYHPSYILRNPINRSKRAIWEDLLKVMERIALPISDKQQSFFLDK